MRKKIKLVLCLAAAVVALAGRDCLAQQQPAAAPAQAAQATQDPPFSVAEHVNEALPAWIRFGGEYRVRVEGLTGIKGIHDNDDAFVLGRLRLDLLFKLGSHVRLFVQGQDSQAGGFNANPDPPVHQNDFDLRQAYIEIRESEKNGWALKVGRQESASARSV